MTKSKTLSRLMAKEFNYLKFHSLTISLKPSVVQDNPDLNVIDSLKLTEETVLSQINGKRNKKRNKKRNRKKLKRFLNLKRKLKFRKKLSLNLSKRSQFSNKNQLNKRNQLSKKNQLSNRKKSQLSLKKQKNKRLCKTPIIFQEFLTLTITDVINLPQRMKNLSK